MQSSPKEQDIQKEQDSQTQCDIQEVFSVQTSNETHRVLNAQRKALENDETFSKALNDPKQLGTVHFIGIAGAGMSVLARMMHDLGVKVQGSDRVSNAKTKQLQSLGIDVMIGQQEDNIANADIIVFSSAVNERNPEIRAAMQAYKPIVHRSDILDVLFSRKRGVAVAGAHGKTTTSSMLAHILSHAGQGQLADPSYACERICAAIADLVVCRSGAGTVSELAALGVPAVYVPLPIGNGEQRYNAQPVVDAGGGVMVNDKDFTPQWVKENLLDMLKDPMRLEACRAAAWDYGIRDASLQMAVKVLEAVYMQRLIKSMKS